MYLEQWVKQQRRRLLEFEIYYLRTHRTSPSLERDDWDNFFAFFNKAENEAEDEQNALEQKGKGK